MCLLCLHIIISVNNIIVCALHDITFHPYAHAEFASRAAIHFRFYRKSLPETMPRSKSTAVTRKKPSRLTGGGWPLLGAGALLALGLAAITYLLYSDEVFGSQQRVYGSLMGLFTTLCLGPHPFSDNQYSQYNIIYMPV